MANYLPDIMYIGLEDSTENEDRLEVFE